MLIFEPTCAYARWALMHRLASVRLSLDQNSLDKNSYLNNYSTGDPGPLGRQQYEDSKQRQVGSHQRQVASLSKSGHTCASCGQN